MEEKETMKREYIRQGYIMSYNLFSNLFNDLEELK